MSIVFHPYSKIGDLSQLVTGTVMIIAASVVIYRIHKKSKNTFAYTLMGLTVTIGFSIIGFAFTDAFRKEVVLPDRVHYFMSEYSNDFFSYLYFISTVTQGGVFALRYL